MPDLLFILIIGFAAYVLLFFGWIAALLTGHLPKWIASFLSRYLQHVTQVNGYYWLMTDRFPPLDLSSTDYPITVEFHPGRVRRWSVFFRFLLVLPAYLISAVLSFGMSVALPVIWVIVLVKGRMPNPLFTALCASQRYLVRTSGYAFLLTSVYPRELFGDPSSSLDEIPPLPDSTGDAQEAETDPQPRSGGPSYAFPRSGIAAGEFECEWCSNATGSCD